MGGNLFKLGRIPRAEYLIIETEICRYLDHKLGANYRVPRYYTDKADFGDMDIIVSDAISDETWKEIRREILIDLKITEYKSIGHVFSTVYKNFQIDYFRTAAEYFESMYNYMSFNDLGNLIGKICRRFNLKYGEHGLAYVFRREDGNYKKDLELTTDFAKICRFLQLDYQKWVSGFANLEEIFSWVIDSPYFSVEHYLNPSKNLDKRSKVRTTIENFLIYLRENKIEKTYNYLENKDDYILWVAENFPEANLTENILLEKRAEETENEIKTKFNGKLLMELLPGLSGKRLGEFIIDFKARFDDFDQFILDNPPEKIETEIREAFQGFRK